MLKANIRQNLHVVYQIVTKYSDSFGPHHPINLFQYLPPETPCGSCSTGYPGFRDSRRKSANSRLPHGCPLLSICMTEPPPGGGGGGYCVDTPLYADTVEANYFRSYLSAYDTGNVIS